MVSTFFCTFAPIIKMFGTMKQRIYKLLLIYVVLVAIFALQHPVFIACYHSLFRGVGLGGVCAATWHGLRMDMAMAGYLAIVPGLLAAASVWTAGRAMRYAACIYSAVAAAVVSLSFVVDLCLYGYWGFRLARRCRGECQRLVCVYGIACRRGLWRRGVLGFTENLDGRRSASAHIAFPDSCHGGGYSPHRSALHPNPRRFYDVDNEPVGRIFQPEPATEPRRDKSVVQFYAFNGASNRLRVAISFYGQCRGGTSDGGFARQASG